MQKNILIKTIFLGLLLVIASQSKAQLFTANSVTLNNYSGDTCDVFAATVNTYLGCINFTQGGVTKSVSGNTITIAVNYTSSQICAGAISYPIFNTNIRRLSPGTYNIVAEAYLDRVLMNSATATSTLTITPCIVIGVEENSSLSLEIYPNPASDFISVNQVNNEITNYRILDLKGSEIMNGDLQTSNKIDVSKLVSGIYFIKIQNSNSTITRKLIID